MTVSIDFNSPVIRIPGYETKYDFAGASNSLVKFIDNNYLQARILQQIHFWLWIKKGGVILRGVKWIYKSLKHLREEAIAGFTDYQVRKAISALVDKGLLIREQLHREHYGGVHARSAYNRQYYYRIDYDTLKKFLLVKIKELKSQTHESLGFVNVANQFFEGHESDLRMSQITTNTTFKANHSNTPPFTPLGKREGEQVKATSVTSKKHQNGQEKDNSIFVSQKTINSQITQFADVVKRPARVEQKINKKIVQKPVQTENVREAVQVEVILPESPKKVKKNKTPKGTKPNKSFDGPWKSLEQLKQFRRKLVKALPIIANSHSPEGLANKIVQQLKKGVPHSYWDDFAAGLPIGTSTQHEWEIEPGVPYPMFIEYLAEKLIQGNNSQTREQAIEKALNIASSPKRAMFFWKECKISLGNALHQAERHRDLGVQALPTPLWTKERSEPTLEEAAIAGNKIALINRSTQAAIEATKNPQIEGSMGEFEGLLPSTENTPIESDPWLDESEPKQKQKKPKISDFASEKLKGLLSKGFGKTKAKSKSAKRYSQPDDWRAKPLKIKSMSFSSINTALNDPILREELTPQLMLSDYELITDEMGRILRIEQPPE